MVEAIRQSKGEENAKWCQETVYALDDEIRKEIKSQWDQVPRETPHKPRFIARFIVNGIFSRDKGRKPTKTELLLQITDAPDGVTYLMLEFCVEAYIGDLTAGRTSSEWIGKTPSATLAGGDYVAHPPEPTNVLGNVGTFMPAQPMFGGTPYEPPIGMEPGDLLEPQLPPGITMTTPRTNNFSGESDEQRQELAQMQHQRFVDIFESKVPDEVNRDLFRNVVNKLYDWFVLEGTDSHEIEASYYEENFVGIIAKLSQLDLTKTNINALAFTAKEMIESGAAANYIATHLDDFKELARREYGDYENERTRQPLARSFAYFEETREYPPLNNEDRIRMYSEASTVMMFLSAAAFQNILQNDLAARTWYDVIASYNDEPVSESRARIAYAARYYSAATEEMSESDFERLFERW